ncbi:unnamed protein product [Mytilus coruscus]|uniref:DNA-directed DNA polymerase n=1 Tax=Mytilus coruscus TaxID=42192 RepID=A0A6J8EMV0_MYTCO|nr:unnamed protein product [Mytilus coruscus]
MKLSKIPKCFGLEELQKGYFPHLFNTKEHQSYKGPYPAARYYGVEYIGEGEAETFWKWYHSKEDEFFDFQSEMYNYCVSDVDILRRGCMQFRKIMMEVTSVSETNEKGEITHTDGIDPYNYVTIASACQAIYRQLFLKEEYETHVTNLIDNEALKCPSKYENGTLKVRLPDGEWETKETLDSSNMYRIGKTVFVKSPIAVVPSEGYVSRDNFSKVSIQWLEWIMERKRRKGKHLHIQHALNGRGGEHRVPGTNYRLDGYVESPKKTAYEFLGCCFHGCISCFPHDRTKTTHPMTKHSMNELYYLTKKRERELRRLGYEYVSIWECEFHQQLARDDQMKEYVSTLDVTDRLNIRDSFFGGRTNAIKLYQECTEPGETIEYYDFTSLYPSVNKYAKYPVGHPVIITSDFQDISNYFGVVKVKVLHERRQLLHPVLPYISNGKLKFPLCKKCADDENQDDCICTDEERAITGTWCTPELELARSKGYKILKIYEVYHFEDFKMYDRLTGEGGLFDGYVNMFLKFKQEATGFPEECQTDQQKMDYIADYARNEGIHLDYNNIRKNPGLRSLAKICLNSFWGKFGQRLNMKQTSFFHEKEADKFFQLLSDPRKDVRDFHIISKDLVQMEYLDDPSFLPLDFKTNIFIAAFTTCWARLKLYGLLEQTGKNALYVDTDSIIFRDKD